MKTNEKQDEAVRPPVIRAMRSWHWRCECGSTNLAKKSSTHEAECWGCGKLFTVLIVDTESR